MNKLIDSIEIKGSIGTKLVDQSQPAFNCSKSTKETEQRL